MSLPNKQQSKDRYGPCSDVSDEWKTKQFKKWGILSNYSNFGNWKLNVATEFINFNKNGSSLLLFYITYVMAHYSTNTNLMHKLKWMLMST